jgi:signal peptidase I
MTRVAKEIAEALFLVLLVYTILQGTVRNYKVEGASMEPSLESGQYLLVNKLVYFKLDMQRFSKVIPFWEQETPSRHFTAHPPRRGEVVVFRFPGSGAPRDFVKRVIGLPGEEVELRNGVTYVDGMRLEEPYLTSRGRSNLPATRMKADEYFVMGDNRRNSNDSRAWGGVPEDNILGKVWMVYWPFSQLQLLDAPASVGRALPP